MYYCFLHHHLEGLGRQVFFVNFYDIVDGRRGTTYGRKSRIYGGGGVYMLLRSTRRKGED